MYNQVNNNIMVSIGWYGMNIIYQCKVSDMLCSQIQLQSLSFKWSVIKKHTLTGIIYLFFFIKEEKDLQYSNNDLYTALAAKTL